MNGVGGSAGVQLIAHIRRENRLDRKQVGYTFVYVGGEKSAFEMELLGLETAITLLVESPKP